MRSRRVGMVAAMLLLALSVAAQVDSLLYVSGKVVDAGSGKPMAHVSVKSHRVGTVTNADGTFLLKVPSETRELVVSSVGYVRHVVPLRTAATSAKVSGGTIDVGKVKLSPSSVVLSEIIVRGVDAKDVVLQAIDKIAANYAAQPNLLKGFYRETVRKRNRFVSVSEGVVDVYKTDYRKSGAHDGVAIRKGRRLLSLRRDDTLSVKLQGGPVLPIYLDVVKERDMMLSHEEAANYNFRYLPPERLGDCMQYVIAVEPRTVLPYAMFRGKLYVDQETLAFTKIDVELDMSDTDKVTAMILKRRPVGLRFTPRALTVAVDYATEGGVTRMSYIRNVLRFRCDWKRRLFKSNYTVTSEMVMTDYREDADIKPLRLRDSFSRRDNFYDKVVFFDDPDFWGTDNIIEPTEDLLDGIEKIKRRLR